MELLLNNQELIDLGMNLRGVRIDCRLGRCWLTQAGDSRDHILRTGSSFIVTNNRHLVITATEPCRLMLSVSHEPESKKARTIPRHWFLKKCLAISF